MFPHRSAVAEVVVLLEQLAKERLPFGPADQLDFQSSQCGQGAGDRGLVHRGHLPDAAVEDRVVDRLLFGFGQLEEPCPMEPEHETATNHVARLTVGLNPVPGGTNLDREPAAAQAGIFRNQTPQKLHLRGANLPTSKTQQNVRHAPQDNGERIER